MEMSRLDFKSVTTANEATVNPMANEPVLPTNSFPFDVKVGKD